MNRLTKRSEVDGKFAVLSEAVMTENLNHPWQIVDLLAQRLAEYEDLGRTPEELRGIMDSFAELKKDAMPLMKAKIDGKVMIAPAVGEFLYEADPEHGVVLHKVRDRHWVINTDALAGDGAEWADQWTDEDICDAFDNDKDAMKKLEDM